MTHLQDRLRDLAAVSDLPVDGPSLARGARRRAARTRRTAVASVLAVVAALSVSGTLLALDEPEASPQPAIPTPTPEWRELCGVPSGLPLFEEAVVGLDAAGSLTSPLSAVTLCPADPEDPVWDELPDTLVTGERVFVVSYDFSGPPVERCGDGLAAAPPFALVGVREDDGSALRLITADGCRRWHQIRSYFAAVAQEAMVTQPDSDTAQHCSPMGTHGGLGPSEPLTGDYVEVTICVHPWQSELVDQVPTYHPVRASVLEGAELETVTREMSQGERGEPRPSRECPYRNALVEISATRSTGEEDVGLVRCVSTGFDDDGEAVYWPVFPPATQTVIERTVREAGVTG
ncbi:hypothetical protein [Ornithinimicrobium cerasi]|uniref:hypothetical protein n=1 Tax=Ornithinimicrobium cerasi TaxID=2248773 RepID=UPI000EFE761D|nr:hypothetical protein [Ornithinimicrobium cerasi]